jgi:hypothetical protein
MKLKCPECNSCFDYVWHYNMRMFWCDLCQQLYDLVDGKYVRVTGIKKELDGEIKVYHATDNRDA